MSPKEIVAKFAGALENFEPIVRQPSNDDLVKIKKVLFPLLIQIPFDQTAGKDNLVGLLLETAKYTTRYGRAFKPPVRVGAYDDSIKDEDKAATRAKKEAIHKTKRADSATYETARRETAAFILHVVEDTWLRELRSDETFYTSVEPKAMLEHLQKICTGTHAFDLLKLHNEMQQYHLEEEGIPEYINVLEDAQKRAARAKHFITDDTLLLIATTAMLSTQRYPRANDDWEDLDEDNKTWAEWKKWYKKAHAKARVQTLAHEGRDQFGAANKAGETGWHGRTGGGTGGNAPPMDTQSPFGLEKLEGYFDNLAAAETNKKAVLEQLVSSNAKLVATNEELAAVVKKLTTENRQLHNEMNNLRKKVDGTGGGGGGKRSMPGHGRWSCPHCKRENFPHKPADCLELPENAGKRPDGWKSRL